MRILKETEWESLIHKYNFDNLLCLLDKYEFDLNTIFLFDIDFTLVHPVDDCFKLNTLSKHQDYFYKILSTLKNDEQSVFLNYLSYSLETSMISTKVLDAVNKIQNRNGNLLCISSMAYGDFLHFDSVHKKRVNSLKDMGIEFKNSFNIPNEFYFDFDSEKAVFFDGVIFTNSVEKEGKAVALNSFIQKLDSISKVVYVDDNPENLEEMDRICHVNCEKWLVLDAYHPRNIAFEIKKEMFEEALNIELKKFRSLLAVGDIPMRSVATKG